MRGRLAGACNAVACDCGGAAFSYLGIFGCNLFSLPLPSRIGPWVDRVGVSRGMICSTHQTGGGLL